MCPSSGLPRVTSSVKILDTLAQRKYDLLGLSETAEVLNTSTRQVLRWAERPDFPEPVLRLRATPVWEGGEVRRWKRERRANDRRRAR